MLTVIILTRNEEKHIARAIASVQSVADRIFVVDSGSTDRTAEVAKALGADVRFNSWRNYATQFNWALDQLPADTGWVLRLDADEILTQELADEIAARLPGLGIGIDGAYLSRRMTFLRRPIRWGGVFPVRVMRLFRHGRGRCEDRWMDEHIVVSGPTVELAGEILDDNLNHLSWWTEKHNAYASREVVDLLNLRHGFVRHESVADLRRGQQAGVKRWIKEEIYSRMPGGTRAVAYFFYRYFLRAGFLDGREGAAFHVLQAFWYRYLVDMKLFEVTQYMHYHDVEVTEAIRAVLGLDVTQK